MQGYTACQVKPALFQSDQPKFWAGPVEAAAFLERGGVVIFIFFSGDKPVKYTDPEGRIDIRAGGGIGLVAVKLRMQYKNNKLTLGIKVVVGYGLEAKVILTDQDEDIGTKIFASTEGSAEIKIGEQGSVGLDAEISYNSQGESENRVTATLTVPGSDLSAEVLIDKGKIEPGISESIEYGISGMVFAGIGYETTTEIDKYK